MTPRGLACSRPRDKCFGLNDIRASGCTASDGERMKTEHYLGGLIILLAAALVLSQRSFLPVNMPRILEVETLPDGPKLQDVRRYTEYGSGILPYTPREQAERAKRAGQGYEGK